MATVDPDIYIGDWGVPHEITIKENNVAVNISSATALFLRYKKPDGTNLDVTPVFKTDGTDGIIVYTFQVGDLDIGGSWEYQALVTTAVSGEHTSHGTLEVGKNL